MIKRTLVAVTLLMVLLIAGGASAAPAQSATTAAWEVPEEGAVAMFRKGDRAFTVGAESGGALPLRESEELRPSPGCEAIHNQRCAQNGQCSGTCIAYMNYWCKSCDCNDFRFC